MVDKKNCVNVCVKDGTKKQFCPTDDGKGLDEKTIGKC